MPLTSSFPRKAPATTQDAQASQLIGLRRDIDRFLDGQGQGVQTELPVEPPEPLGTVETVSVGPTGATFGVPEIAPVSKGQSFSEFQRLSQSNEELQRALEGARQEVKTKSKAMSSLSSTQKNQLSNVKKECSELREDGRAKKRRISEMEDEILKLQRQRDKLAHDLQEAQERSQRDLQAMELQATDERRKQDCTILQLESKLKQLAELTNPLADHEPLTSRIAELEQEVLALRMLLKEWWPEKELAAQLQGKHLELDQELQQLHSTRSDLLAAQARMSDLEQSQASLKDALEARDAALQEAQGAELAKKDLIALQDVVVEILTTAKECRSDVPNKPTAANLGLAWSFLQSRLAKENQNCMQAQRQLDEAANVQKDMQIELSKLRVEAARCEELKGQLQDAQSNIQRLMAGKSDGSDERPATAEPMLEPVELQRQVAAKQQAIDAIAKEAELLRSQVSKLMDVEGRARKLERVNAELWEANQELESRVERLETLENANAANADADADFDPRTTKVLHLARGPSGPVEARVDARSSGDAAGDLEQQQASRQLDRFKKAMRKYVQEFREGIYHLLGWKVEMKGDGTSMRWHLTSRYHEGQELVFQLRPANAGPAGHPAEFDLLGTAWAEQLQGDRQAMAYLEVYSSIPGFLAHVTVDRLAQQTFTR
ncbi:MAD1L1 [Symbiodinium natans]|uniref:MAD1L1 protein n=1 Tax=Symbiodinium natans TaxID=878477 RepID=A0A812R2E1_9DINO|nr:MAD1L1 [Symbiodinium natans]